MIDVYELAADVLARRHTNELLKFCDPELQERMRFESRGVVNVVLDSLLDSEFVEEVTRVRWEIQFQYGPESDWYVPWEKVTGSQRMRWLAQTLEALTIHRLILINSSRKDTQNHGEEGQLRQEAREGHRHQEGSDQEADEVSSRAASQGEPGRG